MFNKKRELGNIGEDVAANFLLKNGYEILFRNYLKPWGELDIISKSLDGTLVFVEVKTVQGLPANFVLQAEDNLTSAKLKKLQRTASLFAGSNEKLVNKERGWRIDLVAVTIFGNDYDIKHYENI